MNGTITKRQTKSGSPSWGYYFRAGRDASGKWIQITKSGFGTRREAAEAMRRAITEHEAGAPVSADARTFAGFFEQWMTEHAGRRCAPKTLERYGQLGKYAIGKFGAVDLHKLTPLTIERALHELEDTGGRANTQHPDGSPLSARTVRHIAFVVHGALETAVRWGLLAVNPMNRVELPKLVKREAIALDRDRVKQLLTAAAGTRRFPLLVLAAATGCRRGELLALTWDDIDFDAGAVHVSKSLEQTQAGLRVKCTKSGKPRRFGLPEEALAVLREHRAQQEQERELFGPDYEQNNLVFCNAHGGYYRPDKMSTRIRELVQRAGLEGVGLHTLRHSNASQLLSSGVPIPVVSKRLGHANPNITLQIYSHALEADEVAAAKIWNDAMADVIQVNRKQACPERSRRTAEIILAGH